MKLALILLLILAACTAETSMHKLNITSVFGNDSEIPKNYTCDGENVNPPLNIEGIPKETQSLVVIVEDPDAPLGTWIHWIVWDIPITTTIKEDSVPGTQGINHFNKHEYGGPCPPEGTHHYHFKVYALDSKLDLPSNAILVDVEKAMKGHVLAEGEIIGIYSRK